MSGKFCYNVI